MTVIGVIIILFFLVILVGQFFLQYYLSTRQARWPGLILPALALVMGLVYALNATTLPVAVAGFLLGGGIGCILHLAVYKLGRDRVARRNRDSVEKMNIQDL